MKFIFVPFVNGLIACAVFAAQAIMPASEASAAEQRQADPVRREGVNLKLEFLQRTGSISSAIYDDSMGVITFRALINGQVVWAVIDTGAEATFVDVKFSKEIGLDVEALSGSIRGLAGEMTRSKITGIELEIPGQFVVREAVFNGTDLSGLSRALNKKTAIIIGRDILNVISFYVDASAKRVVFLPSKSMKFQDTQIVRLPMIDGLLTGTINGVAASMAIDLGASGVLNIRRGVWDRYIPSGTTIDEVTSTDLGGETYTSVFTQGVTLGIGSISSLPAAKQVPDLDANFDAYIGYGFFQGRRTLFDYAAEEILILKD
ncbi:aspartyl protease family protein [Erythrobacter sp. NFXS35]|uniref:retropepsin-like aspartic protease n=1 Tax=Erythrobacter sp. NFXS35 TaxID=2818436 RepID=UPI0032DFF013